MLSSLDFRHIDLFSNKAEIKFSDINIIYGKNGTGKSTMVRAIDQQINDHDHCIIFDGMERFIRPDQQLNAILLGTRNLEIEARIQELSEIRMNAAKELSESSEELESQQQKFDESVRHYQDFVWENVFKHFQSQFSSDLVGWGGSKKAFAEKLKQLGKLQPIRPEQLQSELEIIKKRGLIKAGVHVAKYANFVLQLDFEQIQKVMNNTISSEAKGQIAKRIEERKLESWIQQGKPYLKQNEPCPFCGQEINEEHFQFLEAEFSEIIDSTFKDFQDNIQACANSVNQEQRRLLQWQRDIITEADKKDESFKLVVSKEIDAVNTGLQLLSKTLLSKKEQMQQKISINEQLNTLNAALDDLTVMVDQANKRIDTNNELVENTVNSEKELHNQVLELMRIRCLQPDIQSSQSQVKDVQSDLKNIANLKKSKLDTLKKIDDDLASLKAKTQSEEEAVSRINHLLGLLGNKRFKLCLSTVKDGLSGYYTIEGEDGKRRPVSALSTGEENLIAFLYFFYLIEGKISDQSPITVLIDDPVTSNDDQSMFLIVTLIQNLLFRAKEINTSGDQRLQIFVFTHNSSFYINLKEWTKNPYTKKNYSFHLSASPSGSTIEQINRKNEDIINNYDELWREAQFSYQQNQKQALWNQIRRILETYVKFNNRTASLETAVRDKIIAAEDNEKKLIALQLVKIAHANSHSIDELMQDLSPWSKEQIRDAFEFVMEVLGGQEHFEAHWQ
ncbi:AAA family ATPase [Limosilactobacillus fermentum]